MATVQFSAVLVCCAYFLSSSSASHSHQQQLQVHNEHLAYIADIPCLQPQPEVISVHYLIPGIVMHGKAYFPDVTMLHWCYECTGSCPSGYTCTAKMSEFVVLPFRAVYLKEREEFKKGAWQMEYHELLNHTKCACAVPYQLPPHDDLNSGLTPQSIGESTTTKSFMDLD